VAVVGTALLPWLWWVRVNGVEELTAVKPSRLLRYYEPVGPVSPEFALTTGL
jgi:hypothetical protein